MFGIRIVTLMSPSWSIFKHKSTKSLTMRAAFALPKVTKNGRVISIILERSFVRLLRDKMLPNSMIESSRFFKSSPFSNGLSTKINNQFGCANTVESLAAKFCV